MVNNVASCKLIRKSRSSLREAPLASARAIFTASAKPAEAYPTTLPRSFEGYPFRIHPRPSGRGILRRRVNSINFFVAPHIY
jgi:hypothetical protein